MYRDKRNADSNNGEDRGTSGLHLGTVELTVAASTGFLTAPDQIVWDVGHQCYTHKLLTGRRER